MGLIQWSLTLDLCRSTLQWTMWSALAVKLPSLTALTSPPTIIVMQPVLLKEQGSSAQILANPGVQFKQDHLKIIVVVLKQSYEMTRPINYWDQWIKWSLCHLHLMCIRRRLNTVSLYPKETCKQYECQWLQMWFLIVSKTSWAPSLILVVQVLAEEGGGSGIIL